MSRAKAPSIGADVKTRGFAARLSALPVSAV